MCLLPPAPADPQLAITSSPPTPTDAGSRLTISCAATVTDGLVSPPDITWRNSADTVIVTDGALPNVSLTQMGNTVSLTFDPLRTSHGDQYTCRATISIPAASVNIENSEPFEVNVQSKFSLIS